MSYADILELQLHDARRLFRAGRLDDAARLFQRYLRANPEHFETLHSLGMIYLQTGQFEQAQRFIGEALRLEPSFLDGLRICGIALMHLEHYDSARDCFERALALQPDHIESLVNHATALFELKRLEEALAGFNRVVALDPDNAIAWNNRGNVFMAMQRLGEAVACYDRALGLQPDLTSARDSRVAALLRSRKITRIPDYALRAMFDDIASRFDRMMVDELQYRGHLHVRTLAELVLPPRANGWRMLDLGCGTGLVGEAFKDMIAGGRLDGIDLAPLMIEAARGRGIYDELILGDLETVLAVPGRTYDLIVSADTMVYLGDLAPTFSGVAKRLEPGGFYIFACESKDGDGWEQTPAIRFRHSESYLRREATRARLSFIRLMKRTIRTENAEPVAGFAVALRNSGP